MKIPLRLNSELIYLGRTPKYILVSTCGLHISKSPRSVLCGGIIWVITALHFHAKSVSKSSDPLKIPFPNIPLLLPFFFPRPRWWWSTLLGLIAGCPALTSSSKSFSHTHQTNLHFRCPFHQSFLNARLSAGLESISWSKWDIILNASAHFYFSLFPGSCSALTDRNTLILALGFCIFVQTSLPQ